MLTIRLTRTGATKKPSYRVVVIEKDRARDGRFLEIVGQYDPRIEPLALTLKTDRVEYWMQKGAQPSDTVRDLMRKHKNMSPAQAAS